MANGRVWRYPEYSAEWLSNASNVARTSSGWRRNSVYHGKRHPCYPVDTYTVGFPSIANRTIFESLGLAPRRRLESRMRLLELT